MGPSRVADGVPRPGALFPSARVSEDGERRIADAPASRRRGQGGTGNKRRRGVRRWVVTSTHTNVPSDLNIPEFMCSLFRWLLTGIQQVTMVDGEASRINAVWAPWATMSMDALVQKAVFSNGMDEYAMLQSVIVRTLQVIHTVVAQSARNETLTSLYNAIMWHLKGRTMANAYMEHLLLPQLLALPVSGVPRITGITVHHDGVQNEWYVSTHRWHPNGCHRATEGSNFQSLYMAQNGLRINRRRCFTSNIMEILSCLGLEAVCAMFSNAPGHVFTCSGDWGSCALVGCEQCQLWTM